MSGFQLNEFHGDTYVKKESHQEYLSKTAGWDDDIVPQTDFIFSVLGTSQDFQNLRILKGQSILYLHKEAPLPNWLQTVPLKSAFIGRDDKLYVYIFRGRFTFHNKVFTVIILVAGKQEYVENILTKIPYNVSTADEYPAGAFSNAPLFTASDPQMTWIIPKKVVVVECKSKQFLKLICTREISRTTKVLSALLMLFPHVSHPMKEAYFVIPYSDFEETHKLFNVDNLGWTEARTSLMYKTATLIACLVPSFTQKENLARQIKSRGLAAAAAINEDPPSDEEVTAMLSLVKWPTDAGSPDENEAIGWAIAVTKSGTTDTAASIGDLMPLTVYQDSFQVAPWNVQLLKQMRMVFQHFQSRSLRFGLAVLDLVRKFIGPLGGEWTSELTRMEQLKISLDGRPYTGCRREIVQGERIRTNPRIIYMGVLYYQKCRVGMAAKENVKQFAVHRIKSHIQPPWDASICEHIVPALPPPTVPILAEWLQFIELREAEQLMSSQSEGDREAAFHRLHDSTRNGIWYTTELTKRNNIALGEAVTASVNTRDISSFDCEQNSKRARLSLD